MATYNFHVIYTEGGEVKQGHFDLPDNLKEAEAQFERDPTNEDDLCSDCRDQEALPNRTVCGDCLRDALDDERLERTRQD